jgi:hypothetical protein
VNHKDVVYPRLWTNLWTSAVRWLLGSVVLAIFLALGLTYGFIRAAIGMAMFVLILVVGMRWMQSAVTSQPDPEPTDVSEYGLRYVCTMCGLELKVEVAAKDKAPTHCMEPMVLTRSGGKPPLRPV